MKPTLCESLVKRHVYQRAEFNGSRCAAAKEKLLQTIELGVRYFSVEPYANRLGNRRIHSGEYRVTPGNFFHRNREIRMHAVKRLRASAAGAGFGHLHTPREIQIDKFHLSFPFGLSRCRTTTLVAGMGI
jgi:hypothetical protein